MDAIAADVVPQLMQRLMHCFISERGPVTAPNTNRANGVSGDDIVERLQEKCNTLVRARDFAMDAINSHAGRLLSGIRIQINQQTAIYRLPDEVLAIVFKFTVASEGNSLQPLTTKAPLNVSRVSRAWRAVALSTATLWTTIDVMNAPLARERRISVL
ncbi:hypothetical protein BOTBODRAFT_487180 [Botryobasidium botryosum FD-172 SS1]|uniref:F-box domain-containing protein n=1 Tax=Botryobasidium botryosum (strain FD-172 SS1) TaxID=930990 RepID=A0A067MFI5_BOTB1|nr:hypothetical protein BOTBODRAFT_487180 [Botryobasidium botryosum FD-172 SS1]